jgi:four helix bundle protein
MRISFAEMQIFREAEFKKSLLFILLKDFPLWHPFCKSYMVIWYKEDNMGNENGRKKSRFDSGVYHFAFETAIEIFKEVTETSKSIPEEKIFLTEHAIRHSKGVCINLAEAWIMQKQKDVFLKKLSDAAQDASRTQECLRLALKHNYIRKHTFMKIDSKYEDIFQMLCEETRH